MDQGHRCGALLLMAGEGQRFGSRLPKQFHLLGDREVYEHALKTLLEVDLFDEILLVCHPDWMDRVRAPEGVRVVRGGATRQESSYAGLQNFRKSPAFVLIHDAVRPFVSERILRENVRVARECGAVNTCIPSADTLVYAPGGDAIVSIPKREEFMRGQTPQTFRMDWVVDAHERAVREGIGNASDDCQLVLKAGYPIRIVRGEETNLKITSESDLVFAQELGKRDLGLKIS